MNEKKRRGMEWDGKQQKRNGKERKGTESNGKQRKGTERNGWYE